MTLTKADIVKSVIQKVKFKRQYKSQQQFLFPEMDYFFLSQKRANKIINTLLEIIKQTLARGEDIRISDFGKFQVKLKWARRGRNPQTGEMIIIRSRRTVNFRAFKKLKKRINTYNSNNDT